MDYSTNSTSVDMSVYVILGLALEIPIAVAAVLGNILVCWAVHYNKRLRNVTNYFIVSLAIADMMVGLFAIPFALLVNAKRPRDRFHLCLFMNSFVVFLTQSSILCLVAIALDRYFAVTRPLRYRRVATGRRALAVILLTWIVAFFIGMVPLFGWHKPSSSRTIECDFMEIIDMNYMVYFNFFGAVLPPLIIIVLVYRRIFQEVHRQVKAIAQLVVGSENDTNKRLAELTFKEARAAKNLAIVILIFALCWLPLHFLNTISVVTPYHPPYYLFLPAITLSHANSAMNPFIYAFSNREYRRTFRKLILTFTLCNILQDVGCTVSTSQNFEEESCHTAYPSLKNKNGVGTASTMTATLTPPAATPIPMKKLVNKSKTAPHCELRLLDGTVH
ncbi:Adenosine receptor A2a [Holothuria leucospilota]|uniref:Adenosine receptor A2a n=1 Tax=Holothuria leucospilota TaxID=206669 RepID=A0A9Q1CF85_HOLLE|nr:Adenosine receptor A2a [Holothuria leucospilota]